MADQQKTIFVTGAGSGIGRATAKLFADRGYFVGLFDVNAPSLEETAAMLPEGQRISMTFDVRDRAGWKRAVDTFGQATNRRMHVLFNNAGVGKGGFIDEMTDDDIDLVLDVNLKGVINGVNAALPLLRETPGARIVNTASVAGVVGAPRMSIVHSRPRSGCRSAASPSRRAAAWARSTRTRSTSKELPTGQRSRSPRRIARSAPASRSGCSSSPGR